ncbi:MAG: alanine racemase [Candidatus Abyssobacteria bacterium SURF_17]|jgi:alanine racemase|uniref:Alanine racemase n=1 Tax=Candidatus Abyssobacteria bacterium SURF_17 TaxID=2093361 RepID=A0A419EN95_9BACT|nr:MAG: alanine racemase [Candidatus Abyssubacteria bacterium SURF_17]
MSAPDRLTELRSTRAVVDLSAVEHNVSRIRDLIGGRTELLAVVKADAYGHGAVPVARACERAGAAALGVAMVEEGIELRRVGIRLPILVQCCVAEREIDAALEHGLMLTVGSSDFAERISQGALAAGVTAVVHADIDTGMGRIGFAAETAVREIERVNRLPGVMLDGVYTHFSSSEIENDSFTLNQLQLFKKLVSELAECGIRPSRVHAANSGGVINYPESHLDMVRPGLILYGIYPHPALKNKIDLKPALRFVTAIVFLKDVLAGTPLGYGQTFVASRRMKVATVNVGYADGYPWRLSNNAKVIVRDVLVPVVGRVSMDQLLIDVSGVNEVALGDRVTLLGRDESQCITAEEMAVWAGTIPYEIACGISKRVPREYRGEQGT